VQLAGNEPLKLSLVLPSYLPQIANSRAATTRATDPIS
jgi:hypothetical protein